MAGARRWDTRAVGVREVTHYETLGVRGDASTDEIRDAWLAGARRNHPDGQRGADAPSQRQAHEAMAQLNEAWRVLGSPQLRAAYDAQLAASGRARADREAAASSGAQHFAHDPLADDHADAHEPRGLGGFVVASRGASVALRVLPWMALAAIGLAIFIFSAFATNQTDRPSPQPGPAGPGACVRFTSQHDLAVVPCDRTNDGMIDEIIGLSPGAQCDDPAAVPFEVAANRRYCIVAYEP